MTETMTPMAEREPLKQHTAIKIFGVGNAGDGALEHLNKAEFEDAVFVAINNDVVSLEKSSATEKLLLGRSHKRAFSAAGDPELARVEAESQAARLRTLCEGTDLIFIAAGLGGGMGTGVSPVLARVAKDIGTPVLAFVTLPFDCEGTRRHNQAVQGLRELKGVADGVICLPNQKVLKRIEPNTSLVETFKITNEMVAQAMRCIWRLLSRSGFINISLADLCVVLQGCNSESAFATAEAMGENRAREGLEKLLANPLLDGGQVLNQADAVLVSLAGGLDLKMAEVDWVMEQVKRHCEKAHVVMGAAMEESLNTRLAITVVTSKQRGPKGDKAAGYSDQDVGESGSFNPMGDSLTEAKQTPQARSSSRLKPPPPDYSPEIAEKISENQCPSASRKRKQKSRFRQEVLPLEIVTKGRFEKSTPTIHQGEDLDIPTYIRRGVALN